MNFMDVAKWVSPLASMANSFQQGQQGRFNPLQAGITGLGFGGLMANGAGRMFGQENSQDYYDRRWAEDNDRKNRDLQDQLHGYMTQRTRPL